jgi:hypothetical protein
MHAKGLAGGLPGFAGLAVLLGLACAGCGPGKGDVSGRVTSNGRPVVTGTVSVLGSDGLLRSGDIGPDGTYRVEGVAAGPAKVAVTSPDPWDEYQKLVKVQKSKGAADRIKPPAIDKKDWFPLPKAYEGPEQSPLSFTVQGGANEYDVPLR